MADLRLLIVDDNPTNCRILALQARKWGMIPRATQSGAQALEWLRAGESFDLAILDMQMPGMDGVMLAREIRKLPAGKTMPLVLLTSMGVRSDRPDFASAAFASCLTKPIKPAQLHEALVRVLSGSKAAAPQAPVASAKLDPTLASRLPLRVLLCDDNVINQKVALRLLQQMGYRADLAANGLEALAALDRQPYDLIFMDVMMPEMDGLEATRLIRERQKQPAQFPNYKSPIIIVAMTASAMQGDREKCLAAGMDDYVAKPVRLEDVRAIVERWGAVAARTEPAETTATDSSIPTATGRWRKPGHAPSEDAPVDMARLLDFTDGDPENLRELVTLYLDQTSRTTRATRSRRSGRRRPRKCGGWPTVAPGPAPPAACGAWCRCCANSNAQGFEGKLTNAAELSRQAGKEFERIRHFLEAYLAEHANLAVKS